jgi:hypothetical protein
MIAEIHPYIRAYSLLAMWRHSASGIKDSRANVVKRRGMC